MLYRNKRNICYYEGRSRYWLCKRLHVNIYENKKACTNWVRRILLCDVASDIIQTFRDFKRVQDLARFEARLRWKFKSAIRTLGVLHNFRRKVWDSFYFVSAATDYKRIIERGWLDILRSRIFSMYNIRLQSNLINYNLFGSMRSFNRYDVSPVVSQQRASGLFKRRYGNKDSIGYNKYVRFVQRYYGHSDYWYKGFYPSSYSFLFKGFIGGTDAWYRSISQSNISNFFFSTEKKKLTNTYTGIMGSRLGSFYSFKVSFLRRRIFWKMYLLRMLLLFLDNKLEVSNLYMYINNSNYLDLLLNRRCLKLLISLLSYPSLKRFRNFSILLYRYIYLDEYYLSFVTHWSHRGYSLSLSYEAVRLSCLRQYRKFRCVSGKLSWAPIWIRAGAICGDSSLVRETSNAFRSFYSLSIYEDKEFIVDRHLVEKLFKCTRTDIEYRSLFSKWYYLYLCRQHVYRYSDYFILEHRRRCILRSLYRISSGISLSNFSLFSVFEYFCSGSVFSNDTFIKLKHGIKNMNNLSYFHVRKYNKFACDVIGFVRNSTLYKLRSYNFSCLRRSLSGFVTDFNPSIFVRYLKYYIFFKELRGRFVMMNYEKYFISRDMKHISSAVGKYFKNTVSRLQVHKHQLCLDMKSGRRAVSNMYEYLFVMKKNFYIMSSLIFLFKTKSFNKSNIFGGSVSESLRDTTMYKYYYFFYIFSQLHMLDAYTMLYRDMYILECHNLVDYICRVNEYKSFSMEHFYEFEFFELYEYLDGIDDPTGSIGGYISREIINIRYMKSFSWDSNSLYFSVWSQWFLLYTKRLRVLVSTLDESMSWVFYINNITRICKRLNLWYSFDEHEIDEDLRLPEDSLSNTPEIYRGLFSDVAVWYSTMPRYVVSYKVNVDMLWLIASFGRVYRLLDLCAIPYLYSHGMVCAEFLRSLYINKTEVYYRYLVKRHKYYRKPNLFSGLFYWGEIWDDINRSFIGFNHSSESFVTLFYFQSYMHDKHLYVRKLFNRYYRVMHSLLLYYQILKRPRLLESKKKMKLQAQFNMPESLHIRWKYRFENKYKDPSDFFFPKIPVAVRSDRLYRWSIFSAFKSSGIETYGSLESLNYFSSLSCYFSYLSFDVSYNLYRWYDAVDRVNYKTYYMGAYIRDELIIQPTYIKKNLSQFSIYLFYSCDNLSNNDMELVFILENLLNMHVYLQRTNWFYFLCLHYMYVLGSFVRVGVLLQRIQLGVSSIGNFSVALSSLFFHIFTYGFDMALRRLWVFNLLFNFIKASRRVVICSGMFRQQFYRRISVKLLTRCTISRFASLVSRYRDIFFCCSINLNSIYLLYQKFNRYYYSYFYRSFLLGRWLYSWLSFFSANSHCYPINFRRLHIILLSLEKYKTHISRNNIFRFKYFFNECCLASKRLSYSVAISNFFKQNNTLYRALWLFQSRGIEFLFTTITQNIKSGVSSLIILVSRFYLLCSVLFEKDVLVSIFTLFFFFSFFSRVHYYLSKAVTYHASLGLLFIHRHNLFIYKSILELVSSVFNYIRLNTTFSSLHKRLIELNKPHNNVFLKDFAYVVKLRGEQLIELNYYYRLRYLICMRFFYSRLLRFRYDRLIWLFSSSFMIFSGVGTISGNARDILTYLGNLSDPFCKLIEGFQASHNNGYLSNVSLKSMFAKKIPIENIVVLPYRFTKADYLAMFDRVYTYKIGFVGLWIHYFVKYNIKRYYGKFWYRYVPRDIVHIQRYRRFQQEIRRLMSSFKDLRTTLIYRRLLIFKLVPGISKEWHKLHVRRPYIRTQFEDRVRFYYIMKYKYNVKRKQLLRSLYNRFVGTFSIYRVYHMLYFRLDNILYKLHFIPSFNYLKDQWYTQFWNVSINNNAHISYVQRSLRLGDVFYIKRGLHMCAINYRMSRHLDANLYLYYLLWIRLRHRGLPTLVGLPTKKMHCRIGRIYLWYWYRFFYYSFIGLNLEHGLACLSYVRFCQNTMQESMRIYGFWSRGFLSYKEFKSYMLINSLDYSVRWYAANMCGFVYNEPIYHIKGLHYGSFGKSLSGTYGGHLKFTAIYK